MNLGTGSRMPRIPSNDLAIAQLQAVLDASTEIGIVAIDESGLVRLYNHGAANILGYTADEVVDKETPLLWHDQDELAERAGKLGAKPSLRFIADCANRDQFPHWAIIDKAGRRRRMSLHVSPVTIPGQPSGYLGVLVDVSKQLDATDALRERTEQLERTNRDLEEFTRAASHDLKAPLRSVRSLINFVREDVGDSLPETPKRYLHLMDQRINRMETLLRGLLDYARSGIQPSTASTTELDQMLGTVMGNIEVPEGFTVRQELPTIPVRTYHAPLECCLRNLISNAIKHHDCKVGNIAVIAQLQAKQLQVDVIDDGPGIEAKYRERVFRSFESLQSRDKVEGSGLGLSIVRRYAESVGGGIQLLDNAADGSPETPARGVTMRLTWPVLNEPTAS